MLDLISIHSGLAQKQAWWFLHTSLLLDLIHLAKTSHSGPEPNQIQAVFCTAWPRLSVEECNRVQSGKLVAGWLCSATTGQDDCRTLACFQTRPDMSDQNMTRPSRSDLLWKNGTESDEGSQIQPDSGWMLGMILITAITGLNQNTSESDLACLLEREREADRQTEGESAVQVWLCTVCLLFIVHLYVLRHGGIIVSHANTHTHFIHCLSYLLAKF